MPKQVIVENFDITKQTLHGLSPEQYISILKIQDFKCALSGYEFKYDSEKYERIQFLIDPKTFRIVLVTGAMFVKDKLGCERKQKEIFKELSSIYKSARIINEKFEPHAWDKTGESISNGVYLSLKSGDIGIECYIWSKKIKAEKGWANNLKVAIQNKEAIKFLTYEAY